MLPQPLQELDHTADAGVLVRGADPEETLARLVLAFATVVTGGGKLEKHGELELRVGPADRVSMAVDLLRELHFRLETERRVPLSCEVTRFEPTTGTVVKLETGTYDEHAHAEGLVLKAVTLHEARFEPEGDGWVAQVVFDV